MSPPASPPPPPCAAPVVYHHWRRAAALLSGALMKGFVWCAVRAGPSKALAFCAHVAADPEAQARSRQALGSEAAVHSLCRLQARYRGHLHRTGRGHLVPEVEVSGAEAHPTRTHACTCAEWLLSVAGRGGGCRWVGQAGGLCRTLIRCSTSTVW